MGSREDIMRVLEAFGIDILVDVRTKPTAWCEAFSGRSLRKHLGSRYEWAGDKLGGMAEIDESAIEELAERQKGSRLLLMCAEKDPVKCHRHQEIARRLLAYGVVAVHVVNLEERPADTVPFTKGGKP